MKVLVVGATGALGPHVCRDLLGRGFDVVASTTKKGNREMIESWGAAATVVDVLDRNATKRAVSAAAPDVVVNLATRIPAAGPTRVSHMDATNRLRREGSGNLLAASIEAGAKRYVSESMIFIYGYGVHSTPVSETDELAPESKRGLQGIVDALRENEQRLEAASSSGQIETVSLRFGLLHSPHSESTKRMATLVSKGRLPLISGGNAVHSWVALEDAAQAVGLAVEAKAPALTYNVVDDLPVRFSDYVAELCRTTDSKTPRSLPGWVLRPFASYAVTFLGDVQLPVTNGLLSRQLDWQPRYPTYRSVFEALRSKL